ncbi:Txe/YoeB family addiction module toxin [Parabacteroides sp. AM08-6]|uniref:Txe/YoeB family addiction module toxin n=1 Tax=Parabacteroides sp. AM08-6 TaxID=2292053 RepID=UPI000EFE2D24|nr:Txe/YoeB family addiction module toxin [Parabacteroides sp. AM08-6]RHJ84850.1 Txe/YoeB family addiction module toxin [Parabacteroides sp. AM08-6]
MKYKIELTEDALKGIKQLKKAGELQALKKLNSLLSELEEHPTTGTGKPEQLRGNLSGKWSRRITDKHRLIYEIHEDTIKVIILRTYAHYDDR